MTLWLVPISSEVEMAFDAWLPIGFILPDGQRAGAVINAGQDWQILITDNKLRTLIVKPVLSDLWIQSKLLDVGTMQSFTFGSSKIFSIASNASHELACLNNCKSPGSKAE